MDDLDGSGEGLDTLLALRPRGTGDPVFCVHPGIGMGWAYATLCAELDPGRPLYAIQSPGLLPGAALPRSVHEMAVSYLRLIRAVRPTGPYHLIGWSLGGFAVHEMARILHAAGEEVGLVAVLDSFPGDSSRFTTDGPAAVRSAFLHELRAGSGDLDVERACPAELWAALRATGSAVANWPEPELARLFAVFANSCEIIAGHVPGHYDGDVLLVSAAKEPGRSSTDADQWRRHVGGDLDIHELPCEHRAVLDPEHAGEIAQAVNRHLARPS
ncbi:nonribosomal peptide synthetase [Kitasatospora sp. MMS16-BH015]|uniref:thioesterase domain-containing protein n=1 Tax=Kitasatospora sp. MMS16-BH015 TaxID=2018025 RepID=UPI000CA32F43|nr:thioesterase domain-containing protein [Kitasatospora sp. MMS16-BH015]AUG76127.1 nonribosomal peptide synthetase [Kitasatospora sp. MMS16-BH015]